MREIGRLGVKRHNMKNLLTVIAKHMVDYPDQVSVREIEGQFTTVLELTVAKQDLGKIIGAKGRNIGTIRTLMMAVSGNVDKRFLIELVE